MHASVSVPRRHKALSLRPHFGACLRFHREKIPVVSSLADCIELCPPTLLRALSS